MLISRPVVRGGPRTTLSSLRTRRHEPKHCVIDSKPTIVQTGASHLWTYFSSTGEKESQEAQEPKAGLTRRKTRTSRSRTFPPISYPLRDVWILQSYVKWYLRIGMKLQIKFALGGGVPRIRMLQTEGREFQRISSTSGPIQCLPRIGIRK